MKTSFERLVKINQCDCVSVAHLSYLRIAGLVDENATEKLAEATEVKKWWLKSNLRMIALQHRSNLSNAYGAARWPTVIDKEYLKNFEFGNSLIFGNVASPSIN